MKVLNAIHHPVFGGPHNEVLRTAEPLAKRGWETVTLLPTEPGTAADRLRAAGLEVIQHPLHRLRSTRDPRRHLGLALAFAPEVQRIRQTIRDFEIDLVTVSGLLNPQAGLAARLEGKPVLWKILDTRLPPTLRRPATTVAVRLADALLVTGHAVAELHGCAQVRKPWFTYYPPVDTATFTPDPDRRLRTRKALGIPRHAHVVGTVSNVNPQKGLEYLMRAADRIFAEIDDVWVLVVGADYEHHRRFRARLDEELVRGGIPHERAIFTGAVAHPEHYYPAMDVKLITSPPLSEGIPTTALEALACGVPVVATDVGAMREVIDDGWTGIVVPPLDPSAIAAATVHLLRSRDRRLTMSGRAAQQARERFGLDLHVDLLTRAYGAAFERRAQADAATKGGREKGKRLRSRLQPGRATPGDAYEGTGEPVVTVHRGRGGAG